MPRMLKRFLAIFICVHSITATSIKSDHGLTVESIKNFERFIWPMSDLHQLTDLLIRSNVSAACDSALHRVITGIENHEMWAFKSK